VPVNCEKDTFLYYLFCVLLMSDLLEKWKKDLQGRIGGLPPEKVPSLIGRCPKCKQLGLSFDPQTFRIRCEKCGFEAVLKSVA